MVTDLGILEPDPATRELTLTKVHPGVDADEVGAATGWELRVAAEVGTTEPPTDVEPDALRSLRTVGAAA